MPDVFLCSSYEYDVISFVLNLQEALYNAGVDAVRELSDLQVHELDDYYHPRVPLHIRNAGISIPIFSEAFDSNTLEDIAVVMECWKKGNQVVLPIFYGVTQLQVQNQTGGYAKALSAHPSRYDRNKVQSWRRALATLGALKGFEFKETDGDQSQLIRLVVSRVVKMLKKPQAVGDMNPGYDHLVGMDSRVEAIMGLLDLDVVDVRMVGICGMGGIGKTTLANVIYNEVRNHFEGYCFLKAVRDTLMSRPDGLQYLQGVLLDDIYNNDFIDSKDLERGSFKYKLDQTLRNKKVLIVLDDVDDSKQIDGLAGDVKRFGWGSRIIVTTRNRDVLTKVEQTHIYEVGELDQHDAFLFFCKQAFQQDSPPDKLVALSQKIVNATGGLPLAVETIGSYLFSEVDSVWEQALSRLKTERGIQDKLKISYNALDDKQKQMFLDVVCFFIGWDVRVPAHMWRDCNFFSDTGIEVLKLMSVIKIGDDNKLWVHDQLRDLGKDIVCKENIDEPGDRSRLWGKEALKFLDNKNRTWNCCFRQRGERKVEAIRLDYEAEPKHFVISGDRFAGLTSLRFLDLANANLGGNFRGVLANLRWFGWHGHTELNIPRTLYLENLVVLDLSKSAVNENWKGWSSIKEVIKLEVLNLTSCHHLTRTPDFSSFRCMKRLILKDCRLLEVIDPSIGDLKTIIFLDMSNCPNLRIVPKEMSSLVELTELLIDESSIEEVPGLGGMTNLEIFSARACRSLRQIPNSIGSLVKLQKVLLDNCESLTEVPETIGQLEALKELSISHTRVMELPHSFEKWTNLEILNIDHCPIQKLPPSLGNLKKLEVINASACVNLKGDLPFELKHLTSLKILRLDHTNICSIPACISELPNLQTLDMEGCMNLWTMPKLPVSLTNLKVALTSSMVVPNLPDLVYLKHMEFQRLNSSLVQRYRDPLSGEYGSPRKDVASSSSFSTDIITAYEYEVFLSFRGPDTRETFTDILHKMLTEVGVRVFIDNEALHVGEEIGPDLLRAINQSKISIPILSKDYASSKWCLIEAAKIAECLDARKQKVFPIFFYVAPDEVRHQTGDYGKSFSEHVESNKYDYSNIQVWKDALRKLGARKGWHLSANCSQGTVLKEVVSEILKTLKKPYLDVTENLVGIEDHVEDVTGLLDATVKDVRMLGICGMGGIGKTTVAKFMFNQLAKQFEYHSFLDNIRGTSPDAKIIESLQAQLASDTLHFKFEKFANRDEGKSVLETRIRNKKVLILVDDVDQAEQLDYLVGDHRWFGPGSIILATTRKADVLRQSKAQWLEYEVKQMHLHNALKLFCKHAFRQDSPLPEYCHFSWDIAEATGGLPLAIQAIGSSLSFSKEKNVWKEAVSKLKKMQDIHDKLKVSYDALSNEQQQMFLDIACLFNGANKRLPVHMWEALNFLPESNLELLLLRSLIKIGDDGTLWMHDMFIELGREIIRRESRNKLGEQSRLWCTEDVMKVLEAKKGTGEIKAIHLDRGIMSEKCRFSPENFNNLSNLQFLGLGDSNLVGNFQGQLSTLKWLSWQGHNLQDCPADLHLKNLVIADLSKSEIRDDWNGWSSIKEAVNLEVLNLSGCHQLTRTPDLSTFSRMKRLILEDCQQLVEVSPSIGYLEKLKYLNLRKCSNLEKLPEEMGLLVALVELLLDGSPIQKLPISDDMKKLQIVSAKSCGSLTEIPSAIGGLESLKELDLSRTGVVYLPNSIEKLSNMEVLNIDYCLMGELPQSVWKLRKLEEINASGCRNLKGEIPDTLGSLNFLKVLKLDQTRITSIPESITDLTLLHTLDLKDCMNLEALPKLPSNLVDLKVTLTSSVIVPNLPDLVHLRTLEISHSGELARVLAEIEKSSKIEKLVITKRNTASTNGSKRRIGIGGKRRIGISPLRSSPPAPRLPVPATQPPPLQLPRRQAIQRSRRLRPSLLRSFPPAPRLPPPSDPASPPARRLPPPSDGSVARRLPPPSDGLTH